MGFNYKYELPWNSIELISRTTYLNSNEYPIKLKINMVYQNDTFIIFYSIIKVQFAVWKSLASPIITSLKHYKPFK